MTSVVFKTTCALAFFGVCFLLNKQRSENTKASTGLLRAIVFAARKHANQRRKNATETPYINHPIRVAQIAATLGRSSGNLELLQACVLHDTVEDTDATFEELEKHFGPVVRSLVQEHTDDKTLPRAEQRKLQVANAPGCSDAAKILILSDKIANVEDIVSPDGSGVPVNRSVEQIQEYVAFALRVAAAIGDSPERHDLMSWLHMLARQKFVYMDGNQYPCLPCSGKE